MLLTRIQVRDFRNLAEASVKPEARVSVVFGPNGHGKTNFMEAIYVLVTLRPLRASRYAELVRFGFAIAQVEGDLRLAASSRAVAVRIEEGSRTAFVDGKPASSLDDYFGGVTVVAFTPDDLSAIKGSPEARRRLLDRASFNRFPAYLGESREYHRALRSRNRLLRAGASPAELDAFAEPLARLGARLVMRRRSAVSEVGPRVAKAYAAIASGDGDLVISYEPAHLPEGLASEAELASALRDEIARRTGRDVDRGFTSVGPHVDDLHFSLGGRPAKIYASQGQQRAAMIALKIGEIESLEQTLGRPPLLLLDDVSSELDPERNGFLMRYLAESASQVFITTTDPRLVSSAAVPGTGYFRVEHGSIEPAPRP